MNLKDQLVRHEGLRAFPYRDAVEKLTIGVGRNLDDVGISRDEALYLLDNDISKARQNVLNAFPWASDIDGVRQDVLVNMCFNMGLGRLRGFMKMLDALRINDWQRAAREMLDSHWAQQVGDRAKELAQQMITGAYR